MAAVALDVARRLEEDEGISAEVVDLRSLRPLDRATVLASVRKTGKAVVLEEDWLSYGVGAEIAATIQEGAFDYLDAPVRTRRRGRDSVALRQTARTRRIARCHRVGESDPRNPRRHPLSRLSAPAHRSVSMPQVFMPRLSDTMTEGTVSTWTKGVGERIEKGDVIAEIETDKATMELEAYDAGILEQILVEVGKTVPIGEVIAVIGDGSGRQVRGGPGRTGRCVS